MNSEKIRTLVVGGSGFIGSHVADELTRAGHDVTVYDLEKSPWLNSNQRFVKGDLKDPARLDELVSDFDIVYHFAAIADIGEAIQKRLEAIETNIIGSAHLIEACLKNKVKTFVFASTVYVYSDKGSFYRVTKQAVEGLIEEYARTENLDYRILRYGSLYGPRAQDWNGLRKYVQTMVSEHKVILKSQGLAKREYIHAHDAAKLSVQALDPKYRNQHLLLTGSQSLTSKELASIVEEILNQKIEIQFENDSSDSGHYVTTPYRYVPKHGIKMTSPDFVDFGQGLLEVIEEVTGQER